MNEKGNQIGTIGGIFITVVGGCKRNVRYGCLKFFRRPKWLMHVEFVNYFKALGKSASEVVVRETQVQELVATVMPR
jgi:hypothetical protein